MRVALTTTTLPEVCELVTDGTHDSPKLLSAGVPFIKGKQISSGRIDFDKSDYISEDDHRKCIKRVKPQPNDVLFSNIGSVGDAARVTDDIEFSIKNVALFRPDPKKIDPLYFYYLVISPYFRGHFLNLRSGAAQPFISLESFRSLKFKYLKDQESQQRIASILSTYDDMIENNRRRIQLLEQSARLLYKEWFVHLRFPGHEHVEINDGVPDGWARKTIGECFQTTLGGTPSRKNPDYWGGDVPWINSGEVNKTRILTPTEFITVTGLNNSAAKIMPSETTVLAITGATLGQVSRLEIDCCANQSVVGIYDDENLQNEWIYLFFVHEINKVINHATGGAQQHINKDIVNATGILQPPKALLAIFQDWVKPLFVQIKNLEYQMMSLAKARDLLLPRLMNGEVAV